MAAGERRRHDAGVHNVFEVPKLLGGHVRLRDGGPR